MFAIVPRRYLPFMLVMTVLNIAMVAVSTVVGGLQIEVSQRHAASGRLASLRTGLEGVMNLLGGPVGGWLAVCAFGWTAVTGALVMFSFLPVVYWLYREPRGARAEHGGLGDRPRASFKRSSARARCGERRACSFLFTSRPAFKRRCSTTSRTS